MYRKSIRTKRLERKRTRCAQKRRDMYDWEQKYKKCNNPLCDRQTSKGTQYCCAACATAHEDGFEIHPDGPLGHSEGCNKRHAERGPFKA